MGSTEERRSAGGKDALRWLEGTTVAFVGDSITADLTGNYVTLTVDRVADEIDITKVRVVNSGVDSSSIFDALDRLPDVLLDHQPDVFVVLLGTNDSKIVRYVDQPLVSPEAFEATYRTFLDRIDAKKVVPKILVTPPAPLYDVVRQGDLLAEYWYWTESLYARYVDAIRRIAVTSQCFVADAFVNFAAAPDRSRLFGPDGVHPNILGHRILSELVLDGLRKCCIPR